MKKLNPLFFVAVVFLTSGISAQTIVVTDDNTYVTGHSSSVLDVKSISKGMLPPRMTSAQRIGITSPAAGLLVYQTDAPAGFYYFDGTSWLPFASGWGSQWISNGTKIYYNAGNVGIGTSNPLSGLHISAGKGMRVEGLVVTAGKSLIAVDTITGIINRSDISFSGLTTLIKATYNTDLPRIDNNSNITQTINVTGSLPGDCVIVTPSGPIGSVGCVIIGWSYVSSPGVVSIRFVNVANTWVDPPAMNFYITVLR